MTSNMMCRRKGHWERGVVQKQQKLYQPWANQEQQLHRPCSCDLFTVGIGHRPMVLHSLSYLGILL